MVLQKAKHTSQASKSVGRAAYCIPPRLTATEYLHQENNIGYIHELFSSQKGGRKLATCVFLTLYL